MLVSLVEVLIFAFITITVYRTKTKEIKKNEVLLDSYSYDRVKKEMREVIGFLSAITLVVLFRFVCITFF